MSRLEGRRVTFMNVRGDYQHGIVQAVGYDQADGFMVLVLTDDGTTLSIMALECAVEVVDAK